MVQTKGCVVWLVFRFLYKQLLLFFDADPKAKEACIFESSADSHQLQLKSSVRLHLYTNRCPKGAAVNLSFKYASLGFPLHLRDCISVYSLFIVLCWGTFWSLVDVMSSSSCYTPDICRPLSEWYLKIWMFVQPACDEHVDPHEATLSCQESAAPGDLSGSQYLGCQSHLHVCKWQVVPLDCGWGSRCITEPFPTASLHH